MTAQVALTDAKAQPVPGLDDAVVVGAEIVAGHDGAAELLVRLRHGNGAQSAMSLDAETAFDLYAPPAQQAWTASSANPGATSSRDSEMFDLLIKGGTVVDGTGAPGFLGDVAVKDGRASPPSARPSAGGEARRTLDATGRVVAPGFIDPHTHFDVQLLWDGAAKPALEHGITCVVPGNCSLSLAPLKAKDRKALVGMFQQIEEMPPEAFTQACDWTWEDFAGYRGRDRQDAAAQRRPAGRPQRDPAVG